MTSVQSGQPRPDRQRLSTVLRDCRSRHLLHCLQDGPLTVRDLAVTLAAAELGSGRPAVETDERRQYQSLLRHNYLPRLTDAGLLVRSGDGLVRLGPLPLDRFDVQFPPLEDPDHPSWPAAATVLGRPYRYSVVSQVAADDTVSLSALADRVAESTSLDTEATPRSLAVTLHHVDLPKLASVDLLEYDDVSRTVTRTPATETVL